MRAVIIALALVSGMSLFGGGLALGAVTVGGAF